MTTDRKQHSFTATIFRVLKAFLLLLLLGQMQTASAESLTKCINGTALCVEVLNTSPELAENVQIKVWQTKSCHDNMNYRCQLFDNKVKIFFDNIEVPITAHRVEQYYTASFIAGDKYNNFPSDLGQHSFTVSHPNSGSLNIPITIVPKKVVTTLWNSTGRLRFKVGETFLISNNVGGADPTGTLSIDVIRSRYGAINLLREEWKTTPENVQSFLRFTPYFGGKITFQSSFVSNSIRNDSSTTGTSEPMTVLFEQGNVKTDINTTIIGQAISGGPITITAELSSPSGAQYGVVRFYDDNIYLGEASVINNKATLNTTVPKKLGKHVLHAEFITETIASVSPDYWLSVAASASTTTLSSSQNKSALGKPVIFSAQVSGSNPTGSVSFYDGGNLIGTATVVSGVASLNIATIQTLGDHVITASYGGDESNLASTSLPVTQTILQGVTVNKLSAITQSPAASGSLVILTADLSGDGNGRTGSIEFFEGEALLGSSTVVNNRAEISTNSLKTLGAHRLRAKYSGDANFAASTSDVLTVTIELAKSETVLTSAASPVMAGKPVTLNAQVTGLNPTGSVSFYDKTTLLGKANLQDGVASLTTSAIRSVGVREITAVYSGDELNRTSTSASLQQTMSFNPAYLMPILQLLLN